MLRRIGKYEIQAELGKGGFGKVYRAFDPTVGRPVAIKVLVSDGDETTATRFRAEASAAGNLKHKNIVTVHDFGEDEGMLYLVMEYLEGHDLAHVLQDTGKLTVVEKVRIMNQVAEGLHCAHRGDVVHRDVKPANIMLLPDGNVKIMDFGIARMTRDNSKRLTQSGFLIGTVSYMAPEQLNGLAADVLCDIWSYGTIYYELLTGRHPFHAADTAVVMFRITGWEPTRVKELCPECPEALDQLIHRLLAKDREARYQSLEDVLLDTAPILLELEKKQATLSIEKVQGLVRENRLDDALNLLKGILHADPMHREARTMREQIQKHLQKRSTRTRIEKLRTQADHAVQDRKYDEAIEALQSAARIDPNDTGLRLRIEDLERAKTQREKSERLLARARSELDTRNLTAAFSTANEALEAEPENAEAKELVARIRRDIADRDRERSVKDGLSRAKGFLVVEAYADAVETLESLLAENPENTQVLELLDRARRQQVEHEQREKLHAGISAAKGVLKRGDYRDAVERLQALAHQAPDNSEITSLITYAQEQLQGQEKSKKLGSFAEQSRARLKAEDFEGALRLVDQGLGEFPGDEGLLALRQTIYLTRQEYKRRKAIEKAIQESQNIELTGRLAEAIAPLAKALGDYPGDEQLTRARARLQQKKDEEDKRRRADELEKALSKAQKMIDQGQSRDATELLHRATMLFPGEAQIASLLQQAQRDEEKQQLRRQVQDALARATELEQRGEWAAALGVIEVAQRQHPGAIELEDLARNLRTRASREADLAAIRQHISQRDWSAAVLLISAARERHGDHPDLVQLEQRVTSEQRQYQVETLCAEIRRHLSVNEIAEAKKLLADTRDRFGMEPTVIALEAEVSRLWQRRQALDTTISLLRQGQYKEAEAAISPLLVQDPGDREAWTLYERAQSTQKLEQQREASERGRSDAQQLLRAKRFDEAVELLRGLAAQYPDNPAIQTELNMAVEVRTQHNLRESLGQGRSHGESLMATRQFDAAIAHFEKLNQDFPNEPLLQGDLQAARASKSEQERRDRYNSGRQQAMDLIRERKFDAARRVLQPLLAEFPGDHGLESALRSADEAEALLKQQQKVDQEVERLQKHYRKGDAQVVRERAAAILAEIEDPRVRELFQWADAELSREHHEVRESADELRKRDQRRKLIWVMAGLGVAAIAGVSVWLGNKSPGPATLNANPQEVSFTFRTGLNAPQPKAVSVQTNQSGSRWTATPSDSWITVRPGGGSGPAQVSIGIEAARLSPGSYSGLVTFAHEGSAGGQTGVRVRAVVEAEPPPTGPVTTQKETPPAKQEDRQKQLLAKATKKGTVIDPGPPKVDLSKQLQKEIPTPPPVQVQKPEVLPQVVNCKDPSYLGRERGEMTWRGQLEPGGIVSFPSNRSGPFTGTPLPRCEVNVELASPGVAIVEPPNAANHFSRARVRNQTNGVLESIILRWSVKR